MKTRIPGTVRNAKGKDRNRTKLMNSYLNISAKSNIDTSILEQAGPSQALQAAKVNKDKTLALRKS